MKKINAPVMEKINTLLMKRINTLLMKRINTPLMKKINIPLMKKTIYPLTKKTIYPVILLALLLLVSCKSKKNMVASLPRPVLHTDSIFLTHLLVIERAVCIWLDKSTLFCLIIIVQQIFRYIHLARHLAL